MIRVGIRADGGMQIGMGHIVRCLSLAKEFRRKGCEVCFICRYEDGIKRVEGQGFEAIMLETRKSNNELSFDFPVEDEAVEIIRIIETRQIDMLFIDSYNVSAEYFLMIKPYVALLGYIDDINKFTYPADILINGNIGAEAIEYEKYHAKEKLLLGTKCNLIREEFRHLPKHVTKSEVNTIMITTGGSDTYNMCEKIARILVSDRKMAGMSIQIVVGDSFEHKDRLKKLRGQYQNIILHENIKEMSKLMLNADIAISSGGSTLYELCACGTPTLAFIIAENQENIVKKMDQLGYIKSLGWYNRLSDSELIKSIDDLCGNYQKRIDLSTYMQGLIDGKGVQRVVECILETWTKYWFLEG